MKCAFCIPVLGGADVSLMVTPKSWTFRPLNEKSCSPSLGCWGAVSDFLSRCPHLLWIQRGFELLRDTETYSIHPWLTQETGSERKPVSVGWKLTFYFFVWPQTLVLLLPLVIGVHASPPPTFSQGFFPLPSVHVSTAAWGSVAPARPRLSHHRTLWLHNPFSFHKVIPELRNSSYTQINFIIFVNVIHY